YQYNDGGIRTQKTVNGVTTNYYLNGSTILSQVTGSDQMDFYYDDTGNLIGFSLNGASYYYVKNLQNDIIGILDSNGNQVVSYVYDSWGKLISTSGSLAETVGVQNPFRYRGYYYDVESEMYYLNSRYYDPIISRFVNSDGLILLTNSLLAISDKNLYEYCNNNPIVLNDDQGDLPNWIIGGIIGAAISVATTTINNICTGASVKEWIVSLGVAAITGGLSGVLAASGLPCKPLLDGVISGTGEAAHQLITTGTIDVPSVAYAGALGGTLSYVSAKLSNPANKMIDDGKDLIKKGNKRKANGKVSTRKSAKGAIKRGEAKINEGKALLHKGTAIALGIDVGSSLTSSFMGPPAPKTAVWCYPGTYVYM
ncbi:MAG: RHS repeat-associated core domain-containing protein, partial [Massilioclostridium sp.]|nr:RHS repeat-associated core domain-containing protein [Massilioclostridium sp.]